MGSGNEESEEEAGVSAIRALGSLFKLTEVFLWDDETEVARRAESSLLMLMMPITRNSGRKSVLLSVVSYRRMSNLQNR